MVSFESRPHVEFKTAQVGSERLLIATTEYGTASLSSKGIALDLSFERLLGILKDRIVLGLASRRQTR